MTLISELIQVPAAVGKGAFVLELSTGVSEVQRTLDTYVVTTTCATDSMTPAARSSRRSRPGRAAVYLDGSFGVGKSHFVAVLHAVFRQTEQGSRDLVGRRASQPCTPWFLKLEGVTLVALLPRTVKTHPYPLHEHSIEVRSPGFVAYICITVRNPA